MREIINIALLIFFVFMVIMNMLKKKHLQQQTIVIKQYEKSLLKFREYYELLDQWMMNREQGMCVENYFAKNNYKSIAIYGMGSMGNHLYQELKQSSKVQVLYAIDKKGTSIFSELCVKKLSDDLPAVDAVIITVTLSYADIVLSLEEKLICPMISLDEVICES